MLTLAIALIFAAPCTSGAPLRVRFYDVGQGLSALVNLPDGRNILVDAGSTQPKSYHDKLKRDLAGRPIDLMWITHQHVDHIGGADEVLKKVPVKSYVDNGRLLSVSWVAKARAAAAKSNVAVAAFQPALRLEPLRSTRELKLRAVVPRKPVAACASNENQCSIGLRIDYCKSSILFTGDAESEEEAALDPGGPVTLLQLPHHGSDTSSSDAFLARTSPRYAVVSAGKPGEKANEMYCHPRTATLKRVTAALGGAGAKSIVGFDGAVNCLRAQPANWVAVPASDRLWATQRDGDVVLVTKGDGVFVREP